MLVSPATAELEPFFRVLVASRMLDVDFLKSETNEYHDGVVIFVADD